MIIALQSIEFETMPELIPYLGLNEIGQPDFIWKVDILPTKLFFKKYLKPADWDKKSVELPFDRYMGAARFGNRSWDSYEFELYLHPTWDENSGVSFHDWKRGQYVWEPQHYYTYYGELFCRGINFR